MDEAQRYLRYVLPGTLYGVQTLLLLWITLPAWTITRIVKPAGDLGQPVAVVIAAVLASGAIGYVFATCHHCAHWRLPIDRNVINHEKAVEHMRSKELLSPAGSDSKDTRLEAFDTMSAEWLRRTKPSTAIGAAEKRVAAFSDLAHAAGAARLACFASLVTSLLTCAMVGRWCPTVSNTLRFLAMSGWGLFSIWLFDDAYRRTGGMAQRLYDRILEIELRSEANNSKDAVP